MDHLPLLTMYPEYTMVRATVPWFELWIRLCLSSLHVDHGSIIGLNHGSTVQSLDLWLIPLFRSWTRDLNHGFMDLTMV